MSTDATTYDSMSKEELISRLADLEVKCKQLEDDLNKPVACNRCGREDKTASLEVREDIIQKYFRSMLGQVPFTHTITAFDGQLSATFMMHRGDALLAKYKKEIEDGESDVKYTLLSTLINVKVVDKTTDIERVLYNKSPEELSSVIANGEEEYNKLLSSLDIVQLSFVRNACDAFVILVSHIIGKIQSKDFFKGAGLL